MKSFEHFNTPFEEPNRGKSKGDKRLSNENIDKLLTQYGEHGLSVDGEYFVLKNSDDTKSYIHLWEQIPWIIKDEDGNEVMEPKKIESYLRERLGLPEKKEK